VVGHLGRRSTRALNQPSPNSTSALAGCLRRRSRLVPLTALVDKEISLAALRQAAQRGRLDALQGADGSWRSSRKAVEEYKRTRQHRGPASPSRGQGRERQ
jgi:hypothetical protein